MAQSSQDLTASDCGGDIEKLHVQENKLRTKTRLLWVILSGSMLMAELQSALDSTLTANLQPIILHELQNIPKFPWINVTFALTSAGTSLLWGKLFDLLDRKSTFLAARVLFTLGSTLSGAAPSMNIFIVGKAITGIGGSGTYIGVIKIITALTTSQEHGRYFGYIGFTWGLGTILGPILGGAFTASSLGWRWSFYSNSIFSALIFPAFPCLLSSSDLLTQNSQKSLWNRIRCVDATGAILFMGSMSSTIMIACFGGVVYPWDSVPMIGLLCSCGAISVSFVLQQSYTVFTTKYDRMLPLHILISCEMWILIFQTGCSISILYVTNYYIPLYLQFVRGNTAIRAAANSLPFLVPMVAAMLISGRLLGQVRCYYKLWFIAGSLLSLIMSTCLYFTKTTTPYGRLYGYLVMGGTGVGLYAMNAGPIMATIVSPNDVTSAGTIFGCVDTITNALSLGMADCIFVNRATERVQLVLPREQKSIIQDAIVGVGANGLQGLPVEQQDAVIQSIMKSIQDVWIQMIATASVAFVLSLFMRNKLLAH